MSFNSNSIVWRSLGSSQRDALLLATGERARPSVVQPGELDQVDRLPHSAPDLCLVDLLHAQPKADVVLNVHVREQGIGLKDGVDGPLVGRPEPHLFAKDPDAPVGRELETGDDPQRRCLATT
jgi:hypothetical protein